MKTNHKSGTAWIVAVLLLAGLAWVFIGGMHWAFGQDVTPNYIRQNQDGARLSGTTTMTNLVVNGVQTNKQAIVLEKGSTASGTSTFTNLVVNGSQTNKQAIVLEGGGAVSGTLTLTNLTVNGVQTCRQGLTLEGTLSIAGVMGSNVMATVTNVMGALPTSTNLFVHSGTLWNSNGYMCVWTP